MGARLYLHIGYPKTGTTALQAFCAGNAGFLRSRGLLYPVSGRISAAHYGFSFKMGFGSYDRMGELPPLEQMIAGLRAEIAESGLPGAVLSSEYFILARKLEPVRAAFADFDVKIVVYLRRHDHAFESAYGQSVQSSPAPPWDRGIESYVLHQTGGGEIPYDYLGTLRRWAAAFGAGNIVVRSYPESQDAGQLYMDFLEALEVEPEAGLRGPGRSNAALSYRTLTAIDHAQRSGAPAAFKQAVVLRLIQADGAGGQGRETLLSPRNRHAIVERYRPSYEAIAREFLGRKTGALFAEPPPQRDEPWTPPREPTPQELADMLLHAASAAAIAAVKQARSGGVG